MTATDPGSSQRDNEPAAGRVDVFELTPEVCIVVGGNGQQWRIAASLSVLRGPQGTAVLDDLRRQAGPVDPPARGRDERVVPSAEALIALAAEVSSSGGREQTCLFPFAGYWHRVRLTARDGVISVRTALDCLLATISDPGTAAALLRPADLGDPLPSWSHRHAGPVLPGTLERWVDGSWHAHPLTPAPVVDPLTGLLRRIVRRTSTHPLPTGFVHLHAELPYLESVDRRFRPDALAPAGALDAGTATAIELLEPGILSGIAHYCGADLRQGVRRSASAVEIERGGERWFDLRDWEPHDPALHDIPGFPFSPFEPQRTREWVLGWDQDGEVWVPLSLVHAGYLREGEDASSATNANNLVGLQAGRSWEDAVERACAHIVAHDAVAVWWSSTATAQEAPLPQPVEHVFGPSPLHVTVLAIPSTTGLPVRLAVVDDRVDDIVSLGFAAHAIADQAGELAVVEALIQHASARDLEAEMSLIRNSAALGNGAIAGLAPFDPARRYARAFGSDHRGLIDPMAHIQYGLDPDVVAHTRERTTAHGCTLPVDVTSSIAAMLRAVGPVITLDVTTERVLSAGFRAVRVLIPGFARLQPAAFPIDPAGRLTRARESLNWAPDPRNAPYPGW